jgi:CRISPR type III-B/RAMP module RAMP protein Cmr6
MIVAIRKHLPKPGAGAAHAGLILASYLAHHEEKHDKDKGAARRELFDAAIKASGESASIYNLVFERWKSSTSGVDVASSELEVQDRLIVGLGAESMLETGITLHHTYGMPMIPGSALKGLAAHYCNRELGSENPDLRVSQKHHAVIFGTTEDSGHVVFHDAWILPGGKGLVRDVMTPHHGAYYGCLPGSMPTDFDDPNPVGFLSVAGRFRVAVSCENRDWADFALHLLKAALRDWGVGGKTTSGYGRMQEPVAPRTVARPKAAGEADPPPPGLVQAIMSGECVLCAGSGLAAQAGLPTWRPLLEGLLRSSREAGVIDAVSAAGLFGALTAGEVDPVADELRHRLPMEGIADYLRVLLSPAQASQAHRTLSELPFLGGLNLYPDDLLTAVFERQGSGGLLPSDAETLIACLQSRRFFLVNIFGKALVPRSLLLTAQDFRAALALNPEFKQFLGTVFLRQPVFFVGVSVDGIRACLEALDLRQAPDLRHYALIDKADESSGKRDAVKRRYLDRSFNVQFIDYQPGRKFDGLPAFLSDLESRVRTARRGQESAGVIKALKLENIGPFESLALLFSPSWNVILGDNGMGKTVILRAIAAVLSGGKVEAPAVEGLLRTGARSGSIRLTVGTREYSLDLRRDSSGKVDAHSPVLSPLNMENRLVLGFPAVRAISSKRPAGPEQSGSQRQTVAIADVLPLLRGEPDERMADIKQWLVNLDYAASREGPASTSRKQLNSFFEVLADLMPDLRVRFHSIDPKTMQITVDTESGLVPLEAVSQGVGAAMCWIGTLVERLFEVGGSLDGKDKNGAVVLIDEIDAHMHPRWQRLLVRSFRERFRKVQVIAATHSPLVVASLAHDEIWLIGREPLVSEIDGIVRLAVASDGSTEVTVQGGEDVGREPGAGVAFPLDGKVQTAVQHPQLDLTVRDEDDIATPQIGAAPIVRVSVCRYRIPAGTKLLVRDGDAVDEGEPLTEEQMTLVARQPKLDPKGWRADQILTGPFFGLGSSRDVDTEEMLAEYTKLVALDNPTEAQRRDLDTKSRELGLRLPTPEEREAAREAYEIIQEVAATKLSKLSPEARVNVLQEVKVQLIESITGCWRPA